MTEEDTYPVPQPMMFGHTTDSSLHFQLDVNEIIDEIEHTIKGEKLVFDSENNKAVWQQREGVAPVINDVGLNSMMTILKSRLTKIFALTDFEEKDVENITISIGEDIIDDFYYNWENYNLKDSAAASIILRLITDTVYATLRKSYKRNYLKFLSTITSISEMQSRAVQEKPPEENKSNNPLNFLFKRRR